MKLLITVLLVLSLYASCFYDLKTPYIVAGAVIFIVCYAYYLIKRVI